MKCQNCQSEIPHGSHFCPQCGTKQETKKTCSHCGTTGLPQEALFCPNCGTKIDRGETATANEIWASIKQDKTDEEDETDEMSIIQDETDERREPQAYTVDFEKETINEIERILNDNTL